MTTPPPTNCPYCGATLSPNMRFCGSCGQPVPGMNAGQGGDVYTPPIESTQVQPANQPYQAQPDDPFFGPPPPQRGAPIPGQGQPAYSPQPQYQAPYAAEPPRKRGGLSLPLIIGLVVACVLCACIAGGVALALNAVPNAVRSVIPPEMPLIIGDLQTQVPQLQTELPNLQTQMPALQTQLPNLTTNVPGLNGTMEVPTEFAQLQQTMEAILTPQPPAANLSNVEYEGITFSYDPTLASKISGSTVPAATGPDQAPWEIIAPVRQFKIEGYPLQGMFHEPQIMVYNVDEALKGNDEVVTTVDQLKQLIQGQPTTPGHLQGLPFLPYWNAGQMMHTQVRYLKGPDGAVRGVRYLTQYGQDISKINNNALFYTYQGFAGDGKYYVIAILPVNNPTLPATSENMTTDEADQFVKNYETYMNDIVAQLDAQPDTSFTPDLSKLDAMMQSVEVK